MSNTANLNLERPDKGADEWHTSLNLNMTKLDTSVGNNVASISDLPQIYIETGTFNHDVGDVITLPVGVDAVNEYSVTITPTTGAGTDIGFIYVSKAVDNFTVYCTGNNHTDTYSAVIYYIGDINSYGGSIYRKWYVSPDASITDHGDDTEVGSFAWILDQIGLDAATVVFPGNKTYVVSTTVAAGSDIRLEFQSAAVLQDDGSNADLTINGFIDAEPHQQIFDWGNGSGSVSFSNTSAAILYPEWWGVDGTADDVQIAAACVAGAASKIPVELCQDNYAISSTTITLAANSNIYSKNKSTLTVANGFDRNIFTITGANVVIDGIKIDGDGANQTTCHAIYCNTTASNNIIVRNCIADSIWGYFIQVTNVTVSGWEVYNNKITNSGLLIYDASRTQISFQTTAATTFDDIKVHDNTIDTCGGGIQVYGDAGQAIENIHTNNNTVLNVEVIPIEYNSTGVNNSEVSGNVCQGSGTNGISGYFNGCIISNNVVKDQTQYGIEWNGNGSVIIGNIVENCAVGILSSHNSENFTISSNTIVDTTSALNGDGIRFSLATYKNGIVHNNLIVDPYSSGITFTGNSTLGDVENVSIENNVFIFETARGASQVPTAINIYDGKNISISNNKVYVYEGSAGAWEYLNGVIQIARASEQVSITGNDIIGVDALINHTGITIYAVVKHLYIKNNIIRSMAYGITTTSNTDPHCEILGNSINECTTPLTLQIYHKTEKLASSPTKGAMWNVGDVAWETAPTDSNPPGWICATNVKTEMRVAAVVTATTMEVDDTTGMATGDICGVELDNGTWHWTTATVTDGDTLTLAAGLAGDGAAINNDVICTKWLPLAETGTVKV